MAQILRAHGEAYLQRCGSRDTLAERRILAELTACRTPLMGAHETYCDACGEVFSTYNSCRNRHCPTCGGPARAQWLDRMHHDLLPTTYFHLVFTLPEALRALAYANQKAVYTLLFHAAWQSMKQLAADPRHLGAQIGAVAVLHTWKQDLLLHPHLHCVVPAGGLSPEGTWIPSRSPKWLLPVAALSELFRGKFLAGLKRLYRKGQLKFPATLAGLADRSQFERWLTPLYQTTWNVYCQRPPKDVHTPDAILKYLARYVVGGPISDQRLIAHDGREVTFWARQGRGKKRRPRPLSLPGAEFVRRFLLHRLPRGFHRVRWFGLLSSRQRRDKLSECRRLLSAAATDGSPSSSIPAADASLAPDAPAEHAPRCPSCGRGYLQPLQWQPAPSWREILAQSPFSPWPRAPQTPPTKSAVPTGTPSYQDSS